MIQYAKEKKPSGGIRIILLFLVVLIAGLLAGQVILSGWLVAQSENLAGEALVKERLVKENQSLKNKIDEIDGLSNLEEKAKSLGFISAGDNLFYLPQRSSLAKIGSFSP